MKRNYAETLRSSSAMSDPIRDRPSESDVRLARTEALLREANRDRISEREEEIIRRRLILEKAAMEHAINDGAEHSIHLVRVLNDKEGEFKFETIVVKEISREIAELMKNQVPLMTGLIWEGMTIPERTAMLKELALDSGLVFAESVLAVLPEESKTHLLAWQKQINTGAAYDGSLSVGERAEALIEMGYLLRSKQPTTADFHEPPTRTGLEGRAGSASFVRAVMGRLYLEWLLANEEHPIEV